MGNISSIIWAFRLVDNLTATSPVARNYAQFGVRTGRFCSRECACWYFICVFSFVAPCSSLLLSMSAHQPHPYQWYFLSRTCLAHLGSFINLSSREHYVLHLDRHPHGPDLLLLLLLLLPPSLVCRYVGALSFLSHSLPKNFFGSDNFRPVFSRACLAHSMHALSVILAPYFPSTSCIVSCMC